MTDDPCLLGSHVGMKAPMKGAHLGKYRPLGANDLTASPSRPLATKVLPTLENTPKPVAATMIPSIPVFNIVSSPFKRSQLGLFQGKTKQYGNSVPFSKHKSRRTWLPNVQSKRLFSETLKEFIKVKLTTRALKTINKVCN